VGGLVALALAALVDGPPWTIWLAVPVGVGFMLSPFLLVEGCAGGEGYDELDGE
jgi:hypothetical protein